MTPAAYLAEAGAPLTRAQALLERAAAELDSTYGDALRLTATDIERIRRRLRLRSPAATTTGAVRRG